MRFVEFADVVEFLHGKSVAVIGSGPGCLDNARGVVDGHDVVVRVNNYKTGKLQGKRTDIHYSFYGNSVNKSARDLAADGVKLCMCKCPNSKPLESEWHERNGKQNGIDFRYIYRSRARFWFCDTFVPDDARFLGKVNLLGGYIPTTGFAAILDVLDCHPASVYLTGFDMFASNLHNVDEPWKPGNPADPIGHRPDLEAGWLKENMGTLHITVDRRLRHVLERA